MILPIIGCLFLAGILIWQISGSNSTVGLIEQTDQRIALTTLIEKLVVDEETGLRGYQVTSDPRFLQPYHDAQPRINQAIPQLRSILGPNQAQMLDQFTQEHETWRQSFKSYLPSSPLSGRRACQ